MKKSDVKRNKRRESKRQLLISRREELVKQRKEEHEAFLHDRAARKRLDPVVNLHPLDFTPDGVFAERDMTREEAIAKLNHNLEILKALEEVYDREQEERKKTNEGLEDQGVTDMQEKLQAVTGLRPVS